MTHRLVPHLVAAGAGAAALALAFVAAPAARAADAPPAPAPAPMPMQHAGAGTCPALMAGVTPTAVDVENGAALEYKTTGDVAALRQRVQALAEMHNAHVEHRAAHQQAMRGMGRGMQHMMWGGAMADSTAKAVDVDGGARLVFTPKDPKQLDALRTDVRDRAGRAGTGTCPMQPMPRK